MNESKILIEISDEEKPKIELMIDKLMVNMMNRSSVIPPNEDLSLDVRHAMRASIIAVDFLIEDWKYIDTYIADMGGELHPNLKFWIKVKKTLMKMLYDDSTGKDH